MVAYFSSKYLKRFQATLTVSLLLFCLLGTHWIGFNHSVSHAGLHSQSVEKCSADDAAAGITHSSDACHLFDALTLAGFVPVGGTDVVRHPDPISAMVISVDSILAESSATAYQSRAPPTFIL
ncbi:hypothetical protein [Polynucleobacter sp. MWH-Berg-3C6]|uniref:hypothetical protein n=1 Tax=Polynucleobacter sp. MWH-Berg-3C6 TaxID=1855882 RepID=UPI001C0CF89D|nr:hypothetical protein [Polynucleobacter sp. MWH-Berg-3C6]MBU3550581.1 hypothetical protein [Polynucleobacter sp. MWH-Berg-3C6]